MAKTEDTFTSLVAEAQSQALSAMKQGQDLIVRATELAARPLNGDAPFIPSDLPSPRKVVEANFDFAARVLALQQDFALRLADAVSEPRGTTATKS